jgi:hypothetical protein
LSTTAQPRTVLTVTKECEIKNDDFEKQNNVSVVREDEAISHTRTQCRMCACVSHNLSYSNPVEGCLIDEIEDFKFLQLDIF